MNVDIQQILTHVVGFLVVLWVLKRYAWKPLLGILEERRARIQSDFDAAAAKRVEAEETAARYAAQLRNIEADARAKIQEAIADGRRMAGEIREEARAEAKRIIDKARADVERELAKAQVELKEKIVGMTISATERIIRRSLDDEGHRRLISGFLDELDQVSPTGGR
ncbi:MAG: F0F1 ATP synthase subunit B [candidate division Zixibacteria bacterium]|nr:F0F1 ATP synthase subunit B [candidate division Zixibacteria bacterium]